MKNIGNEGWGLAQMIVYTCIILLFLIISACLVLVLYQNLDKNENSENPNKVSKKASVVEVKEEDYTPVYENYLVKMQDATTAYLAASEVYYEADTKIPLSIIVQEGYIEYLYDPTTMAICSGYSIIKVENEIKTPVAFLKCDNYLSEGYEEN